MHESLHRLRGLVWRAWRDPGLAKNPSFSFRCGSSIRHHRWIVVGILEVHTIFFVAKSRCPSKKGGPSFSQRAHGVLGSNKGLTFIFIATVANKQMMCFDIVVANIQISVECRCIWVWDNLIARINAIQNGTPSTLRWRNTTTFVSKIFFTMKVKCT